MLQLDRNIYIHISSLTLNLVLLFSINLSEAIYNCYLNWFDKRKLVFFVSVQIKIFHWGIDKIVIRSFSPSFYRSVLFQAKGFVFFKTTTFTCLIFLSNLDDIIISIVCVYIDINVSLRTTSRVDSWSWWWWWRCSIERTDFL